MAGRIKNVTFTREIADDEKMAPQMKGIVASVVEAHGTGVSVTVEQIVAAMEGNITTRQPLERIFGYYAPKLEELGLITVERSEAAAPKPRKSKEKTEGDAPEADPIDGDLDEDEDLGDELDEDEDEDDESED